MSSRDAVICFFLGILAVMILSTLRDCATFHNLFVTLREFGHSFPAYVFDLGTS